MINEQAKCNNMLTDIGAIHNYIHCRKECMFTLVSGKTGKRFTYKIKKDKDTAILSLLTGDDNTADYTRIARIYYKCVPELTNSQVPIYLYFFSTYKTAQSGMAIAMAVYKTQAYLQAHGEFWVPARCRVCGRLLTTPQAIADGVGHRCKHYMEIC